MKINFKSINDYGKLSALVSVLILFPILIIPFFPEEIRYIKFFVFPSIIGLIISILFCKSPIKEKNEEYGYQKYTMENGSITVLYVWIMGFVLGALPFYFSGYLNFTQSLFESVSAWTTTGLSVVNVEDLPNIFLFYRSFMQFCGGLGFVLVMITFTQGKQAMTLYSAEGHGDQIKPNLKKNTKSILNVYIVFLLIGTLAYIFAGMEILDSLLHSMSSLSTGGFSTKTDSIGYYNSIAIELITIILMIVGTTNFTVLILIMSGKFKKIKKISEIKFMISLMTIFGVFISVSLLINTYKNLSTSFRVGVFNTISAISTTGYSTASYDNWAPISVGIIILSMIIGGGMGSTAGGIKLARIYLTIRIIMENFKKRILPNRYVSNPHYYKIQGKTYIDEEIKEDYFTFIFSYFIIFIIGSLLLTITGGYNITEGMFEFASSLGTVGLSLGLTNHDTNSATLIVQIIGMILGRLEMFIVFIAIYNFINRINNFKKNCQALLKMSYKS